MTPRVPSWVPEGLLLFAVVFGPLAFGAVEPWSRALLQIDLFLLLAACALRGAPLPKNPVIKTLLPAFLVLLALAAVQGLAPRSPVGPAGLWPSTASARATGRELLLWASYASLLWAAPQVLASREALRRFTWTLFLLGAFIAVVGIIQLAQGNGAYYGLRIAARNNQPFGPYPNHDHAASMMVMSVLAGIGLILSRWAEFKARGEEGLTDMIASQSAAIFLLGIVLFGVISAHSRGAFNSLFAASWLAALLATGFIESRAARWTARGAAFFGIPAYILFLWFHPVWIGYLLKTPDVSTSTRFSMYRGALTLLHDLPVWGVGLGALQTAFPAYQDRFIVGIVDHVHGDWLEFIVEMGSAGAVVALAGFAAFFRAGLRAWFKTASRTARCLAGGSCAALAAFLVHGAVDFIFHIPANAVIFIALLCAFGSAVAPAVRTSAPCSRPWRFSLAAAALVLSALAVCPAVAWFTLTRADSASGAAKMALMARALRWDDAPATRALLTQDAFARADREPAAAPAILRAAIGDSTVGLPDGSLDSYLISLEAQMLMRLGRINDAFESIHRRQLLGD